MGISRDKCSEVDPTPRWRAPHCLRQLMKEAVFNLGGPHDGYLEVCQHQFSVRRATRATCSRDFRSDLSLAMALIPWIVATKKRARASGSLLRDSSPCFCARRRARTTIQAHSHRDNRMATVVSGNWQFGYGTHFNEAALKSLPPGSVYSEPAGVDHFARTTEQPVTVHICGFGPTNTHYFDPANDPDLHQKR